MISCVLTLGLPSPSSHQGLTPVRVPLVNSTADKSCGELFVFVNLRQDGLQSALAVAVQAAWRGYVQRRRLPPILYGVSIIQVGCGLSFQSIRVRGVLCSRGTGTAVAADVVKS